MITFAVRKLSRNFLAEIPFELNFISFASTFVLSFLPLFFASVTASISNRRAVSLLRTDFHFPILIFAKNYERYIHISIVSYIYYFNLAAFGALLMMVVRWCAGGVEHIPAPRPTLT